MKKRQKKKNFKNRLKTKDGRMKLAKIMVQPLLLPRFSYLSSPLLIEEINEGDKCFDDNCTGKSKFNRRKKKSISYSFYDENSDMIISISKEWNEK